MAVGRSPTTSSAGALRSWNSVHVVVEHVAIRKQPARPRPHHVEVLRLVGVDAEAPRGHDAQHEADRHHRHDRIPSSRRTGAVRDCRGSWSPRRAPGVVDTAAHHALALCGERSSPRAKSLGTLRSLAVSRRWSRPFSRHATHLSRMRTGPSACACDGPDRVVSPTAQELAWTGRWTSYELRHPRSALTRHACQHTIQEEA